MTSQRRSSSFIAVLILLGLVIAACATSPGAPRPTAVPGTGLAITALAGPTCPVERPGDPACAPRPVAGATVIVVDGQGTSVATVVLDALGAAAVDLPPGDYVVQAQPADGLMGTPGPVNVTVVDGALTPVALAYDTGIR
jgi:hypothetical protein